MPVPLATQKEVLRARSMMRPDTRAKFDQFVQSVVSDGTSDGAVMGSIIGAFCGAALDALPFVDDQLELGALAGFAAGWLIDQRKKTKSKHELELIERVAIRVEQMRAAADSEEHA